MSFLYESDRDCEKSYCFFHSPYSVNCRRGIYTSQVFQNLFDLLLAFLLKHGSRYKDNFVCITAEKKLLYGYPLQRKLWYNAFDL